MSTGKRKLHWIDYLRVLASYTELSRELDDFRQAILSEPDLHAAVGRDDNVAAVNAVRGIAYRIYPDAAAVPHGVRAMLSPLGITPDW